MLLYRVPAMRLVCLTSERAVMLNEICVLQLLREPAHSAHMYRNIFRILYLYNRHTWLSRLPPWLANRAWLARLAPFG